MRPFKPTYLYVKTHNVTGLKYFGKTTSNRKNYRGSGSRWVQHISKHGYDVTTEIVGYFDDRDECMKFALEFSEKNKIVESPEWANLVPEDGVSSGDVISSKSEDEKQRIAEKRKRTMSLKSAEELAEINKKNSINTRKFIQENPDIRKESARKILEKRKANGKPWHSDETIQKIKENNKAGTAEVRQKLRLANIGKKNPEHSARMRLKTGINSPNTRIFEIVTPAGKVIPVVGCANLKEYCSKNSLAYEQFIKHINNGKIEHILARRPRPEMKNCLGYELREISKTLDKQSK